MAETANDSWIEIVFFQLLNPLLLLSSTLQFTPSLLSTPIVYILQSFNPSPFSASITSETSSISL
jgi:hypothetical protein